MQVHTRQAADVWLARGAVVIVAALQLFASAHVAVGPRLFAPGLEIALLIPLSVGTAWTHQRAGRARTAAHRAGVARMRAWVHALAVALTALLSAANLASLVLLVRQLVAGRGGPGPALLLDAADIWTTNVIIFALWFWNVDRSGPASSAAGREGPPEFLFSTMLRDAGRGRDWRPGFIDYLYLAFTNATALSPTDTMPLTARAKLLMMFQACVSLITIVIVAGRAVNILQ
ncbi:MAG TPA: hypothetical protein VMU93_16755 [Caulobacteraceae bacterium]|nr:hypothetical protein [Caulobacteraceae bacterium]